MTLDEMRHEAVSGGRFTAAHLQPGCYVEHDFARGYVKRWPVDDPSDVPAQCDFVAKQADYDAEWTEVEAPVLADDHSDEDTAMLVERQKRMLANLSFGKFKPRDFSAEALAMLGKVGESVAAVEAIGNSAPWGVILPGAVPVIDVDATHMPVGATPGAWGPMAAPVEPVPARDAWGLPKP